MNGPLEGLAWRSSDSLLPSGFGEDIFSSSADNARLNEFLDDLKRHGACPVEIVPDVEDVADHIFPPA